jgi:hypothetical protein
MPNQMPFRKFSSRSFEYKSKNVELQEEEIHGSLLSVTRKAVVVLQGLVRDIINTRRLSIEQRGKRQSIQVNRGPVDIAPRSSNPTAHSRTRRAGVHDLHRDLLSRRLVRDLQTFSTLRISLIGVFFNVEVIGSDHRAAIVERNSTTGTRDSRIRAGHLTTFHTRGRVTGRPPFVCSHETVAIACGY